MERGIVDTQPMRESILGFQSLSGLFEQPKPREFSKVEEKETGAGSSSATSQEAEVVESYREQHRTTLPAVDEKEKYQLDDDTSRTKISWGPPRAPKQFRDRIKARNVAPHAESVSSGPNIEFVDGLDQMPGRLITRERKDILSNPFTAQDSRSYGQGHESTVSSNMAERENASDYRRENFEASNASQYQSSTSSGIRIRYMQGLEQKPDHHIKGGRQNIRLNPFLASAPGLSSPNQALEAQTPQNSAETGSVRPWGLAEVDRPEVPATEQEAAPRATQRPRKPLQKNKVATEGKQNSASPSATDIASRKLSHVKSTGEAHMVDIGGKQATKRVAISSAYVRFSNPEPYRLIVDNENKKGDVLGTARIAGIMAAKRTSDIVPLCHPIQISRVDVVVSLRGPSRTNSNFPFTSPPENGGVSITARVDTEGSTGVEMEALTAVSGAALTVYDMCKAVDKSAQIGGIRLIYKSGGKSGLYCSKRWAKLRNATWFSNEGLEVPVGFKLRGEFSIDGREEPEVSADQDEKKGH